MVRSFARGCALMAFVTCVAVPAHALPTFRSATAALNTDAVSDTGEDTMAAIATDGAGTWLGVWRTTNPPGSVFDPNIVFARSTDAGVSWTAPAIVDSSPSGNNTFPHVAASTAGTWIVGWNSPNTLGGTIGFDLDVLFVRSTDAGATWTPTAALNANAAADGGDDGFVHLATDDAGTWVAVWESDDSLGDTIGSDDDVLFARSVDDGVTWSAPAALNQNAATDVGTDAFPSVATDGKGTWVAVWMSTDPLGGPPSVDFDVLVARSTDGGSTWSMPVPIAGAAAGAGFDGSPTIGVDAAGNWLVAWHSTQDSGTEVVVTRSSDDGATWTLPTAISGGGTHTRPMLATPRAGTWLAAWEAFDPVAIATRIVLASSADGGASWSVPVPASVDDASGIEVGLAADASGRSSRSGTRTPRSAGTTTRTS